MIAPKMVKPTHADERRAYQTAKDRSQGICEGCALRPATDVHHRVYRSRSGLSVPENLLHLCGGVTGLPGGNHSGCHGIAHTLIGEQLGWSVRTGNNPALVPVFSKLDGRWQRLDATGGRTFLLPADAVEYMVLVQQIRSGVLV